MTFEPLAVLAESGGKADGDINLFTLAMAFAALNHPGLDAGRYFHHAETLAVAVGTRCRDLIEAGAADDAATRLAALKHILADRESYRGDSAHYYALENADIIRVIDRRMGLPVSLCLLYIHAACRNGWKIDGLNFPGHFLARIEQDGVRLIFDPFDGCRILDAPALRGLLKRAAGERAELRAEYYQACTNREILLRLQNNIKLRLIEAEDYAKALECVERMRLMAPADYRLLLDAGVLYAKKGLYAEASGALRAYIEAVPDAGLRFDAQLLLDDIERRL